MYCYFRSVNNNAFFSLSMNIFIQYTIIATVIFNFGCASKKGTEGAVSLADPNATTETKALYYNLKKLVNRGILFGQQDATAYGIGWKNEELRSDINDVCGAFPAVYGWDIAGIGSSYNIDSVKFDRIKFWIKSAYERGGVQTISWHLNNPVSGKNAWELTPAVAEILPGGKKSAFYNKQLDLVAEFLLDLKSKNGTLIPIIFRPFHECNGGWFWWGAKTCTSKEYKLLYQYTVTYLRDLKNVHNLIYAYSPDIFGTEQNYLERFPGEKFVDVVGFDNYFDFSSKSTISEGLAQLRIVVKLARKMNKIAALTETGYKSIPDSVWWTESLLNPIKNDSIAKSISWIMVWRNANKNNHYVPYPGHLSAKDFVGFENDPYTLFEGDLPNMYKTDF
jgi:mannan endo-1,4-beta-mannosidase